MSFSLGLEVTLFSVEDLQRVLKPDGSAHPRLAEKGQKERHRL